MCKSLQFNTLLLSCKYICPSCAAARHVPLPLNVGGIGATLALLRWYPAIQTGLQFAIPGEYPTGVAFDGANIWVTNNNSNTVTKLQASDGTVLGTFNAGTGPFCIAFDGANIWVTNYVPGIGYVSKL